MRRWLGIVLVLLVAASGCSVLRSPMDSSSPAPLAYVGLDDHVYSVPLEGGDPRRLSAVTGEAPIRAGRRFTRWPTWAPDGSRLAFMRFDISRVEDDRAAVYVVSAAGTDLTKIFESTEEAPIYLGWAPDASSLAVLTQREQSLRLQLLDPKGSNPPQEVGTGSPLYFAWSPDAQSLLVHLNGDHRSTDQAALWRIYPHLGAMAAEQMTALPTDFRAPAWSPDGRRMAFTTQVPGGQSALSIQEPGAPEATRLTVVGAEPVFLWSPASDRLAFSSRVSDQVPLYSGIETIRTDGGDRQRVTDTNVAAFFWSPDGKKLAYAGVDTAERSLVWFVSDLDGKNRRQLGSFVPSDDQFFMFRFFDQFAQSAGVWSPDGKFLVYAGTPPDPTRAKPRSDSTPASGAPQPTDSPPQIFVARVDGSSAPRVLADGSIALWPAPTIRKQ